ncbi:hypothetical protein BCR34DRAFT_361833 [Clohesyomyces aquaticus]|uniref:Uncharacterized protein n=1 Tax=Clohesyomyces aquaticus TaxID=1231657 RepID=A0A1Y2A869_9PLEO|nr:hypothetical protein BCR34DRAFT_361833 [Clohesyomyces aquaticus]
MKGGGVQGKLQETNDSWRARRIQRTKEREDRQVSDISLKGGFQRVMSNKKRRAGVGRNEGR